VNERTKHPFPQKGSNDDDVPMGHLKVSARQKKEKKEKKKKKKQTESQTEVEWNTKKVEKCK
jgi:hypothetical protein